MSAASSDRVALRHVAESVFGTIPTTPTLKPLRFTSESLNYNIENVVSNEIRPDRAESDLMQVKTNSAGDMAFELMAGAFDDLLSAALCANWATNVLKNGTTYKSFTVQKHFEDVSHFHNFTGARVNSLGLNIAVGQIVTGSFGFMAKGMSKDTSQIAGATVAAANTKTPINASANVTSVEVDGTTFTGCISTLGLNIVNNLRAQDCVGSATHKDLLLGKFQVTGNLDLYFEDSTMYDRFYNATEFSLEWILTGAEGDTYTFFLPRVKYETGQVVAGGPNTDVLFSGTYRALYDETEQSVITITRTTI